MNLMMNDAIHKDERICQISYGAFYLYTGMWKFCDQRTGVVMLNSEMFTSQIFAGRDESIENVRGWIGSIIEAGLALPFKEGGESYAILPSYVTVQCIRLLRKRSMPLPPIWLLSNHPKTVNAIRRNLMGTDDSSWGRGPL